MTDRQPADVREFTNSELRDMIADRVGQDRVPKKIRTITDTSDFFQVAYDDVLLLHGEPYFIRNYEREGRFGIDDEPKFWVRRAVNLIDGEVRILKFVFHEKFQARVGDLLFDCARSPRKEARILSVVSGHPNFMHGFSETDSAGNIVRVIDLIRGVKMHDYISGLPENHEEYFHESFPLVLDDFIELAEAIAFLHRHGEKHGDIRRDHIIRDKASGTCRWIDFDFNYQHKENLFGYDLFGLGNILAFLTGGGDVTTQKLKQSDPVAFDRLYAEDLNIIFNHRVVNLKKVFPYIPDSLNFVLLHFSQGAETYYDDTSQLLTDLKEAREELTHHKSKGEKK